MPWMKPLLYLLTFLLVIARNTQIYIQQETDVTRAIDPWAGSYYVEKLTQEIADKAWEHIQEIESLGGMAKAIETGIPENAHRRSCCPKASANRQW